ncbi:MAG: Rrf2 family transcriptional regulator [Ignavibacteriales bacterium]|nr:Rrf2 family transcriptional regulator [Ignavibacteriales bacterium]
MSASTKLSTTVKALCYLAEAAPAGKTSQEISEGIGINASKLRKIFSLLVKSKMIESNIGTYGGFVLKKNPADIHLQEIYCAIEDRKAFHLNVNKEHIQKNERSAKLNDFFLALFADIQIEIEDKMKSLTLKQIIDKTK